MADSRATKNADSLTNAQGEFNPHKPPSEPLTTKGHQVGQHASPADDAPEFQAQTLPAGTAPASRTFQPDPVDEVPGQANNPDETLRTGALDMPGATSKDVNMGLGKPAAGESSYEKHHEGAGKKRREGGGLAGTEIQGEEGLLGEGNKAAQKLATEHTGTGPLAEREHNVSLEGAESKEPVQLS